MQVQQPSQPANTLPVHPHGQGEPKFTSACVKAGADYTTADIEAADDALHNAYIRGDADIEAADDALHNAYIRGAADIKAARKAFYNACSQAWADIQAAEYVCNRAKAKAEAACAKANAVLASPVADGGAA